VVDLEPNARSAAYDALTIVALWARRRFFAPPAREAAARA
jgi:hypothetical protein